MLQYPLKFKTNAKAPAKIKTAWSASAEGQQEISCAIPKIFGGEGDGYSPEDFCALAILNCFIGTFKVFAEKSDLNFSELIGEAEITLDRSQDKVLVTQIDLHFTLTLASDPVKAKNLLEEAQKNCIISNSLKSKNNFNFTIN